MVMIRCQFARLLGLGAIALVVGAAAKGDSPPAVRADRTKSDVVERPTRTAVQNSTTAAPAEFANPKVQPGKIRWHPTFAAACEAAHRSRKPVLLFQMMGKLDDQFC